MTFYTDYPMLKLGDEAGKEAPIREIGLIAYDGDKYVVVSPVGTTHAESIKSGYIYTSERRLDDGDDDTLEHERVAVRAALQELPPVPEGFEA